ncbi:sodium/hydrogen exchanger [Leptolyngbya sp. NIES-3755]|nr:sodium/hydrogen exchanger [Leptolyngbya sp. NIES-3755]
MFLLTAGVLQEPIVSFVILLAVILIVPILFERLRVPGLVGLLASGVLLGSNGLGIIDGDSETMNLLSDIGLVYLMFVAGLEIDIEQFTRTRNRSIGFGTYTFLVPLITGTIVGRFFGFDWNPAILIGSLFASHTLLAYPIVSRLGVVTNEAVTVTIGATIFTDIGALLVLAICVGIHAGDFTIAKLTTLLGSLVIYTIVILFGFDKAGREFFRRTGNDEGNQFLFVLLAVFLASVGAQLIGVEKIVGAFLSGLAVNRVVGNSPVKEKVLFVGSVLFIPIFFVDMGLLIRVPAFIQSLTEPKSLGLTIAIVVGLIFSKMAAAVLAKFTYRYSWREMMVMGSLSLPQVAATLAATLVGYRAGLLTEGVLNSVIVLMLVTSILGPILTARFANELRVETLSTIEPTLPTPVWTRQTAVLVPVYNPKTEAYLLELAALITRSHSGRLIPLAIALSSSSLNSSEMQNRLDHSESLLKRAAELTEHYGVDVSPLLRIDDNVAQGITRTSREQRTNLIVMGWGRKSALGERLFRTVVNRVLSTAPCPVAVARLVQSPREFRRILVPIENPTPRSISALQFAHSIATETNGTITLLHVCDRATSPNKIAWIKSQLSLLTAKIPALVIEIQIVPEDDRIRAIALAAESSDLLILQSAQRLMSAGGLALNSLTAQIAPQIHGSIVLLGEPESVDRTVLLSSSTPLS